ncbi:MAG: DNA-binding protein [Clostridia bacterium]|nr:DNA-binding protein [Clostridia bacterium]
MAKDMQISLLLGYYGELLSNKQKKVAESYYFDDLSLAEIAENTGTTRQAVLDNIRHAEQKLKKLEDTLGFASKMIKIAALAEELQTLSDNERVARISAELTEIAGWEDTNGI